MEELKNTKKKFIPLTITIIGIAIVALIISLIYLSNPKRKMLNMFKNTFNDVDNQLITDLNITNILKNGKYTHTLEGTYKNTNENFKLIGDAGIVVSNQKVQGYVNADASGNYVDLNHVDGIVELNNHEIILDIPMFDRKFVYDYTKKSNGYIKDFLEENAGEEISLENINKVIEFYYDLYVKDPNGYVTKQNENIKKLVNKYLLKDMTIVNVDSEKIIIDEKEVECKGKEITLTEDNIIEFFKQYFISTKDMYGKEYIEMLETSMSIPYDEAVDDLVEIIDSSLRGFGDVKFTVYSYKNKLSKIVLNSFALYGEETSLEFNGGDYRMQNIKLNILGETLKISCENVDNVEKFKVMYEEQVIASYTYDLNSGNLIVSFNDGHDNIEFDGIRIKNEKNKLTIEFNYKDDYDDISVTYTLRNADNFKKLNSQKVYLNDANKAEIEREIERIDSIIYN